MPSTRISNRAPGRMVIAPILFGLLGHVYDEREFLSRYGICSLSKLHEAQPFEWGGHRVTYEPAESAEKHKGGNSNWRGPIWFPTTFLMEFISSLAGAGRRLQPN